MYNIIHMITAAVGTITAKNQLTIPVALAIKLGLSSGAKVFLRVEEQTMVVERISTLREIRDGISTLPNARKYSVTQAIKLAKKKEAQRIQHEGIIF